MPKKKSKSGRSKAEITAAGRKQTKEVYKKEMAKEAELSGRIKRHIVSTVKEEVALTKKAVSEDVARVKSNFKRKSARVKKMLDFRGGTSGKRRWGNKK
tara:strand:+ start:876 stop:1172 length:297 start_codon:yes stop_codon:yes gene_type:complete